MSLGSNLVSGHLHGHLSRCSSYVFSHIVKVRLGVPARFGVWVGWSVSYGSVRRVVGGQGSHVGLVLSLAVRVSHRFGVYLFYLSFTTSSSILRRARDSFSLVFRVLL